MIPYTEQLARIKQKLPLARQADNRLKVFGASSHKYQMAGPVSQAALAKFEAVYQLSLPAAYRQFMAELGPGAGPFYGIYPLEVGVEDLVSDARTYLHQPCLLKPKMTDEAWATLTQCLEDDLEQSDEEYEQQTNILYAGLLPIGTQGCTYYHALVLNGPYRGRVVNIDTERNKPTFCYEANFLDWYERWLDEIISGLLLQDSPAWFGYLRGGSDTELIAGYRAANNLAEQLEYLAALARFTKVAPETVALLAQLCEIPDVTISRPALNYLAKFDYSEAQSKLKTLWQADALAVYRILFLYGKSFADEWQAELRITLTDAAITPDLFQYASYVLAACQTDLSALVEPFTQYPDKGVQRQASYTLQEIRRKHTIVAQAETATKPIINWLKRIF